MPDAPLAPRPRPPAGGRVATAEHYGLDIETDTTVDGLDPSNSAVVAVAVSTVGHDTVLTGAEADILRRLDQLLRSLPAGVIVTWNGGSFDLPFLEHRARLVGVPLDLRLTGPHGDPLSTPWPPPPGGCRAVWGAHGHLDGFRLYRADVRRTLGLSCGLKAMARLVGLPVVEVDRTGIHELDPVELVAYVGSDARLARQLVDRRMPAAAASIDRGPLPVAVDRGPLPLAGDRGPLPVAGRSTGAHPRHGPQRTVAPSGQPTADG